MVLIKHFRSTSIWKAFVLNAMTASLTIYIAITVKAYLDRYEIEKGGKNGTTVYNSVITLLVTFCTALFSYYLMYQIFGFGGGMLTLPH